MKRRLIFTILIIFGLTACNGTMEIGLEHTISNTSTSAINQFATQTANPTLATGSSTTVATSTTASPSTTLDVTTTGAPTDLPSVHTVQIFLIAINDNGQSGDLIGCGDSVVPVQVEITPTYGVLKAALAALLSIKDLYYGESGLYNALYQADLQVDKVNIVAGKAEVYLTGTMMMGGECDIPRVQGQLEQTVLQFSNITEADIYINGRPLADVLSLK
jgi:hypothetical protein